MQQTIGSAQEGEDPMGVPPAPRPHLARIPVPPPPRAGREAYLRLDLNEDLSGPLARTRELPRSSLAAYHTPDMLAAALGAHLRLPPDHIRVTTGADEAIYGLLRAYLDPGDGLLLPWPTFGEFAVVAAGLEAEVARAPYGPDLAFPLAAYRALLAQGPRVAVLVTPANPTGESLDPRTVLALAAESPGTLLVVDEAYAEYGGRSILAAGLPPPNVAVIRTFSKAYGLASSRVGYLVAHPRVLGAVRQVLPTYSLAGHSLALALAALMRSDRLMPRAAAVHRGQRRIVAWGEEHGMDVHPTEANFVLLRLPDTATAVDLAAMLEAEGVLVSDRTAVLPGTLRVAVGAPRHVSALLLALERTWDALR